MKLQDCRIAGLQEGKGEGKGRGKGFKAVRPFALAATVAFGLVAPLAADNWPQFRGLRAGVAPDDPALPDTWSATENVAWKVDIPGTSWSSPIVWGDHVIVTTAVNTRAEEPLRPVGEYVPRSFGGTMAAADLSKSADTHKWFVYDIDFRTGKIRWQREVRQSVPGHPRHQKNSLASETPSTDGERIYAYFSYAGLFAFDMNGKPLWSKPMDPVKVRSDWGGAASPVVHRGRVYIVNDNDQQSFIAAYDAPTGNELWRVLRDEASNWTTPFVWENPQRTEIVTAGTGKIRSYDLSGRLLWELKGMSVIAIPTPLASHGLLFIESGYPADKVRPVYAIRPGATGDISLKEGETSNQYIVWSNATLGTYNTSPLVHGDCYYTLLDRGLLSCHDPRTGKEMYPRQRVTMDATAFTASPWAYNGKVFALSEDGDTYVMQGGPEFKVLGKNSLNEMALATPAVANGSLIIRTASKLYRITKGNR
jgi:outer membrane protein assembly factor BamB